ncbi:hypothetical protein PFICI_11127 [Pestalotiopsis fici W106-1]|uniref:NADH:flavin oxidoreductase/NADH oxidase N-terminal domain-containing protein n=1 Tax=Pestalotiopsis fici (strain W106-1 / CGMCC3.15140) TaxID=1229662 RepID=W3WTR8_PESFW|nr:uncharacterized protein PFICI_11127 [Pestalotiopsis fici W106-1]ETS77253.1 hypothetical protein PFICI_11127 [Pestalotiopsis fici W106-1]
MSKLLTPLRLGRVTLNHRVALAPMTRTRTDDKQTPLPSVKEYYGQRASVPGTLLITEGTIISPEHGGYPNIPGIYTDSQIAAWKEVTDAVHDKGSYIFLQMAALGRSANPGFLAQQGYQLMSSSDVPMKSPFSNEMHYPVALTEQGIRDTISAFAKAAQNAIAAGFDGVEIHGANGYLVDQFIQDVSNTRVDDWGGSIEKRSRFALEVTRAVAKAVGSDRTAIRLSPWSKYQDMGMSDPLPQFAYLAKELGKLDLAYIHACESETRDGPSVSFLLQAYGNASPVVVAGGYNTRTAKQAVDVDYKDHDVVVAFGKPFISNPDLPHRVANDIAFESSDPATHYGQTPEGYIDYKFSSEFVAVKG